MSKNTEALLKRTAEMTDSQVRLAFVQLISSDNPISGEDAEKILSKIYAQPKVGPAPTG